MEDYRGGTYANKTADGLLDFLEQDEMLDTIWRQAAKHLNRASELLE